MPKTRPLTQIEREKQERALSANRIGKILAGYMYGITASELAETLHVSDTTIQRRLRGAVVWDVPTLIRVCDVLGVPDIERARMLGGGKCKKPQSF